MLIGRNRTGPGTYAVASRRPYTGSTIETESKLTRCLSLILIATAWIWLCPAAAAVAADPPPADRLDEMEAVFDEGLGSGAAPGGAVSVVDRDAILRADGFGRADGSGRPVTADTPFLLGSTSKSFTAMAVMQLVEDGKVGLDAAVTEYVPEFELAGDSADRITVRQVLGHTSGLPLNPAGGPILKGASDGTPLEALEELRGKELSSEPGTEMAYVNANYVLAGLVVERASGMPYAEYVERNIFEPLDMKRSFAEPDAARAAGLAAGHRYVFGLRDETDTSFHPATLAAGYLMSSAGDLALYLASLLNEGVGLNGRRVLSREGVREMLAAGEATTSLGPWADGVESRYAMGWFVGGPWDEPAILHPGDAVDSSSMLVLLPERGIGVATLVNASNELPVPGNPAAIPRMQRNAVDALLGERVTTGTSVRSFYVFFDLAVLLLVALSAFALYRAIRDVRSARPPTHRGLAIAAIPLWMVAAGVFIFYPAIVGYGSAAMLAWHPDLAVSVWLIGALLAGVLVSRVVWLARTRHSAG